MLGGEGQDVDPVLHDDQDHLDAVWPSTGDGEFRLALVQAVTDFWEKAVREEGAGSVPVDGFAIEILVDRVMGRA